MPLFFVISGYLYSGKDYFFTFVYKKVKGLYIPYLTSSLIMYVIFIRIGQEPFSVTELVKILIMYRTGPLLGALWFLRVLFWASIIYDSFNRIISRKAVFFLSIILLIIGVHISLPLRISNILVAIGFMAIGNIAKKECKGKGMVIHTLLCGCMDYIIVYSSFSFNKYLYCSYIGYYNCFGWCNRYSRLKQAYYENKRNSKTVFLVREEHYRNCNLAICCI